MTGELTRREMVLAAGGAAAVAMTGCGVERRVAPASNVSILKVEAYDQRVYDVMRRVIAEHAGDVRGRSVLLKPNLVEFEPQSSINKNPILVHAAFEAFRALGAAAGRIAQGPGHPRHTLHLADPGRYLPPP